MFRVLADDLTGAAECAALGFVAGFNAGVALDDPASLAAFPFGVFDADSRSLPPADAARRHRASWLSLSTPDSFPSLPLFKKIDSVLRGNVVAEIEPLLAPGGYRRVLLLPQNPSRGRVIRQGTYYVDGIPLDQTAFARDPQHPARSAEVAQLLRLPPGVPLHRATPGQPLPSDGWILAEASTPSEVASFARQVDTTTLPAGGADFLGALLPYLPEPPPQLSPAALLPPSRPRLFLSGSTAPAARQAVQRALQAGFPVISLPPLFLQQDFVGLAATGELLDQLVSALRRFPHVILSVRAEVSPDPAVPRRITRHLGHLAASLLAAVELDHVYIEGGDTAAAIARYLGWKTLRVCGLWGPGAVCLEVLARPGLHLTLKPGSYAWPPGLLASFSASANPYFHRT